MVFVKIDVWMGIKYLEDVVGLGRKRGRCVEREVKMRELCILDKNR